MKKLSFALPMIMSLMISCGNDNDSNTSTSTDSHAGHDHSSSDTSNLSDTADSMSASFKVQGEWQSSTLMAGEHDHTLHVMFKDSSDSMISGVEITEVTPWMPAHGHGSDTSAQSFMSSDGGHMFMISGLRFSMAGAAGDWEIRIKFTKDGVEDEVHLPVTLAVGS